VIGAAVDLADADGIDALTMRNLSQDLGVVPMALYKHVAHKEELLDLMVDVVYGEIKMDTEAGWRDALRGRAISMREALVRHPWAVGLMESGMYGPARLRDHEKVMKCLREDAAMSFPMALHALSLLDGLVYGFALQQRALGSETVGDHHVWLQPVHRELPVPPEEYPFLTELLENLSRSGYDYAEEFEFGLNLVLDGLEHFRKTSPAWKKRRTAAPKAKSRSRAS
jgi:AcrR family transcriptional regulator